MWVKSQNTVKNYSLIQAQRWLNNLYPNEQHGVDGDCINPKCDYTFTPQDEAEMTRNGGWFTCPKCDQTYNYLDSNINARANRAGLSPGDMGSIGEKVVEELGTIPMLGKITWVSSSYHDPIDMIAGVYGVEVKTIHSEAQQRFKMGGGGNLGQGDRSGGPQQKLEYCFQHGLRPALVGVRLNFYTDKADIFVRPDSLTDTWIGAGGIQHAATVDFTSLNPYKHPEDVPPASEMPNDDVDADIPF